MRLRRAQLWLLDEPLTNLDAAGAEVISAWLRKHTAAGGTAVIATHQTDRVQGTAALEVEL
jgi:heme exporter protein A